jgi:hypothetical protein
MGKKWRMRGFIVGSCNCDWGCPCNFDARPTQGNCKGLYVWAIKQGTFGGTRVDGLTMALAASFPGAVHEGGGTGVYIIDERANREQRQALETLGRAGNVGLPFDIFAKVVSRWLDTFYAPIEIRAEGIRSTVKIGGGNVLDLATSKIKNPVTGKEEELYLDKPTGFTSKRSEVGMSLVARLNTQGLSFDNSGKYAEHGEFDYSGG